MQYTDSPKHNMAGSSRNASIALDNIFQWISKHSGTGFNNTGGSPNGNESHDTGDQDRELFAAKEFLENYMQQQEQNADLQALIENTPDLIYSMDMEFNLLAFNQAFKNHALQVFGIDAQRGINLYVSCPDDRKAGFLETSKRGYNRERFSYEYQVEIAGQEMYFEVSVNPILEENDEQTGISVFAKNITEKKQYEKQLHSTNQKLETAQKIARLGYWELDMDKQTFYWSKEVYNIWGVTPETFELNYNNYYHLIHPDDRAAFDSQKRAMCEESNIIDIEHRIVLPDNSIRYIHKKGELIKDETGKSIRFEGTVLDITERKRIELELLQFKNVIESSRDGIGILKKNGRLLFINPALGDFLGHTVESLRNVGGALTVYKDKQFAEDVFSKATLGGYWNGDIQLNGKDGKAVDFYLSTGPVMNSKGELVAVYGIHTNITERKMLETELLEYHNRIKTILESITDGFYSVDKNWIVTYWNKEAERILGINREDILGQNLWEIYVEAVPLKFYSEFHKAVAQNEAVHFEEYFHPMSRWFEVTAYPSESGLSVYFKDITERKHDEQEIRTSKERYDIVAKVTNDTIWDWDLQTNKLYWNDSLKTLFGYDPAKIGDHVNWWFDCIHPDDRERVRKSIYHALENNIINLTEEYRFKSADGSYRHIYDRGFSILDERGETIRMIGAMQDITRVTEQNIALQKRAQELAKSNDELEQFAYIASHDLQEPLRMVTGFLKQLEKKYSSQLDETASKYIWFAVDGASRMRKIIFDLLEYSRLGRLTHNFEKIELHELLQEVVKLNRTIIDENKTMITWENLPVIYAEKTPVQQVFQNLIGNAIKYRKKDHPPEIKIRAEEIPGYWQFSISDNGIGIDPKFFDKIFIIFQRLHHREEYSGTGIGLAICKKIIENHKGRIWLESEPGKGSIFYFTISKDIEILGY